MSLLETNQVKLIEADVERARITLRHLSQELIDHICCEVEEHMSNGKSFEQAYILVKEQTGIKVLQQIQENALYLIDKNYAIMKTTMKITGNISLALIAIGTIFKIWHWPGSAPMLLLGFVTLCLAFFPAAIYLNYTYESEQKKPLLNLSILAGGIVFMAGVLFKVMHWPGSAMLLLVGWSIILCIFLPILLFIKLKRATTGGEKGIYVLGVIALIIFEAATMFKIFHWPGAGALMLLGGVMLVGIFLPLFTNMKYKRNEITNGQFIFVITTSMYAVVLTFLLALTVSEDVLNRFTKNESSASMIARYYEKKSERLLNNTDSISVKLMPQRKTIAGAAKKVRSLIEEIKLSLIQQVEQVDEGTARRMITAPKLLIKKDNYDGVNRMLFGENNNGMLSTLKTELENFRKTACELCVTDKGLVQQIENLMSTSDKTNSSGEIIDWETACFHNNVLIGAIAQLSTIEKNVGLVESRVQLFNH